MDDITIMQGDQYSLQFELVDDEGKKIPASAIANLEIVVGYINKTTAEGTIIYDQSEQTFLFPLSQQETFAVEVGAHRVQVRIKSLLGCVVGYDAGTIEVRDAQSEVVL